MFYLNFMIEILLTTYNGDKFLKELIESIIAQTYQNWVLKIRDDGSTDGTLAIIEKYCNICPKKVIFIKDEYGNLGSTKSFEQLLKKSSENYIMFCDQDDVWMENKIEKTYEKVKLMELENPDIPVLVFSDLTVVDENLRIIHRSYFKSQKVLPDVCYNYKKSMGLSVAAGCTMMINRKAIDVILPFPNGLIHDHWIINNVAYWGKCDYINEPTIYYRQHGKNSVGAQKVGLSYLFGRLSNPIESIRNFNKELNMYGFKVPKITVWILKIGLYLKRFALRG